MKRKAAIHVGGSAIGGIFVHDLWFVGGLNIKYHVTKQTPFVCQLTYGYK